MHGDLRCRENQPGDIVADCGALGAAALDELEPCGNVEKQISHLNARAPRSGNALMLHELSALVANQRAQLISLDLRLQRHARNRRDRRQRFAAESE
ncbi:hypothetical protein SDC9_113828 [bioreactor metagenome]|uniref:Uncharacterized protein n=1 Tax=bioreactor metagenome TaxID=1076179 RepID=A0A645BNT4_9ZZZZ